MLGPEPTLIIQALIATLVAANTALTTTDTISVPPWVSVAISVAIVGLGALVNRSQVIPKSAVAASQEQGPDPVSEDLNPDRWLSNRQIPSDGA